MNLKELLESFLATLGEHAQYSETDEEETWYAERMEDCRREIGKLK